VFGQVVFCGGFFFVLVWVFFILVAAAMPVWQGLMEKISFCCTQKEVGFWSFDIKLRLVRVRLLLRKHHGIFKFLVD